MCRWGLWRRQRRRWRWLQVSLLVFARLSIWSNKYSCHGLSWPRNKEMTNNHHSIITLKTYHIRFVHHWVLVSDTLLYGCYTKTDHNLFFHFKKQALQIIVGHKMKWESVKINIELDWKLCIYTVVKPWWNTVGRIYGGTQKKLKVALYRCNNFPVAAVTITRVIF